MALTVTGYHGVGGGCPPMNGMIVPRTQPRRLRESVLSGVDVPANLLTEVIPAHIPADAEVEDLDPCCSA